METVDREVRIEIDIVECIFTINGLSIQRVDVLENIEKLEKQLFRQKRRLSRKEQNSNNSKATLEKIENKLDNVYNDYMNKCISVVIKNNPTCVVIVDNDQKFLQKYYEFVIRMKVRCKMHGIEFKVLNTYA